MTQTIVLTYIIARLKKGFNKAMKKLFNKAAVFTDVHFGKKNNNRQFNIDCENFIHWFVDEATAWGADVCIMMGDWHDNRRFINVSTLNYSLSNLELLDKTFGQTFFILGNHDLYYREKREINSVEFARNLKRTQIVNEIMTIGDCSLVPWLVGDEYKEVKKLECKYMFGHFELPTFLMNAMAEMPDKGELYAADLNKPEYVFSGHFHKRQQKENIWYIGSPFPHNFSDTWDFERGMMFLEWGKEPFFKTWPEQPVYINVRLSEIINEPEKYINKYTSAKIVADVDLSYEEAQFLRETFLEQYGAREITVIPEQKSVDDTQFTLDNSTFKTVDQIVIEGLSSIETTEGAIDHKLLIELYNGLDIDSH